jgi:plasmid segregation protein ParM
MEQPRIDLLVVGLPVADLAIHGDELRARLVGRHELSDGRSVGIGRVLVLAQPLGGFVDFALGHGIYQEARETMNLVVDPGFFPIDWVVARGIRPVIARCGSFAGGMHAVLGRLARALAHDHGVAVDDELLLDEGLRTGNFMLYGSPVELAAYEAEVRPVIDQALGALTNAVGDGKDIRNIVLVGGAAALYRNGVQRCFPRHRVHTVSDAVFANVRGFQRAGEQLLESGGVR